MTKDADKFAQRHESADRATTGPLAGAPLVAVARFGIGDRVRHRLFGFRGVVFDVDPVFANSEEWYESIPEPMRPSRDQPFYHLFADNGESAYVAYVSQQNLEVDPELRMIEHPGVDQLFREREDGGLELDRRRWN